MSKFATPSKTQFEELRQKFVEKKEVAKKPVVEEKKFDYKFTPSLIKGTDRSEYTIRILPHIHVNEGVDEPWVENRVHIFKPKGSDKNTYQICPTSHGNDKEKCPICEHSKFWFAKGDKTSEDIGRIFWKKKRWHVNVYVKEDPRTGEANQTGKVLIWEFGPKVMDKLSEALTKHKLFFWDVEEGFDFNLVVKLVGGYNNFDSSDFARNKSRLVEDDDALDSIHSKIYDLRKMILEQKIRPYEELKAILEGKKLDDAKSGSSATVLRDSDSPRHAEHKVEPDVSAVDVGEVAAKPAPVVKPKPAGKPKDDEIDIDKINFDDEAPF